jgi:hypothetical protein
MTNKYEEIKQRCEKFIAYCERNGADSFYAKEEYLCRFGCDDIPLLLKALELALQHCIGRMRTNGFFIDQEEFPEYWIEQAQAEEKK